MADSLNAKDYKALLAGLKKEAQMSYEINSKMQNSLKSILEAHKDILLIKTKLNALDKIDVKDLKPKQLKALIAQRNACREQLEILEKAAKSGKNIGVALANDVGKGISTLFSKITSFVTGSVKSSIDYFYKQDKAIRTAQLSMGILTKGSSAFRENILNVSKDTQMWGVDAAQLAEMQADYSEQIGRAVILTKEGLKAMSLMAAGTSLGAEGAAKMAYSMDLFGLDAKSAMDYTNKALDKSHAAGVNAANVLTKMSTQMKVMQGYHFKKGLDDIIAMRVESEKTHLQFEDIAGFADQLMNPEGAVELSAKLQVLGGKWAQLADPFRLMYESRNDIAGLTDDIAKATAGTAQFNKETGAFDISALELNRLREVAKATGMDFQKLSDTAYQMAKFAKIDTQLGSGFKLSPAFKEFIESTAQFDKSKGQYYIQMVDKDTPTYLKDLNNLDAKRLADTIAQKKNLEEQSIAAQSFDDLWKNIKSTFKTILLPFLNGVFEGIRDPIKELTKMTKDSDLAKGLTASGKSIGKSIGEFVVKLADVITKFGPGVIEFAVAVGKFIANFAGAHPIWSLAMFEVGKWILNGAALGTGFLGVTKGAAALGNMFKGGGGGGPAMLDAGKGITGKGITAGKWGATAVAGIGGTYLGGKASEAVGNKSTTTGDWAGTIASIAIPIIAAALAPETMGASLLALPAIGAGSGFLGKMAGDALSQPENDFISRPGQNAVPFSSSDTLLGYKSGGPLADALANMGNQSNTPQTMNHTFDPIRIEGSIKLESNGNTVSEESIRNNPILMAHLTKVIQENLRMGIGGGKLSPSPLHV